MVVVLPSRRATAKPDDSRNGDGMSLRARLLVLVALATLVPAVLMGLRFVQEPRQRDRGGLRQSVRNRRRNCHRSRRKNPGHRATALWLGARPRSRHPRQGRMLGVPVRRARSIPAIHRYLDDRSGRQPVLRFVADRAQPRSAGPRLFQESPGHHRRRDAGARVRPADGQFGAADRLSGVLGTRRCSSSSCWRR